MTALEVIQEELGAVTPETNVRELLDSLELTELTLQLEAALRIDISDREMQQLSTVGDIVKFAESKQ